MLGFFAYIGSIICIAVLILLAIAFLIAMSFMSESMLERQYGVIYFALILPFMILGSRKPV